MPALQAAVDATFDARIGDISGRGKLAADMREIWLMQPRFDKRTGSSPAAMLAQPRFRAAFDFMRLRAEAGEVDEGLVSGGKTIRWATTNSAASWSRPRASSSSPSRASPRPRRATRVRSSPPPGARAARRRARRGARPRARAARERRQAADAAAGRHRPCRAGRRRQRRRPRRAARVFAHADLPRVDADARPTPRPSRPRSSCCAIRRPQLVAHRRRARARPSPPRARCWTRSRRRPTPRRRRRGGGRKKATRPRVPGRRG